MALLWFNPPVYVRSDRPGMQYGINHVEGAAEQLMAWDTKGPKWTDAVQACVDAFEGKVSPNEVRQLFEEAAEEAGMLLSAE
jgi:hypothetical protein